MAERVPSGIDFLEFFKSPLIAIPAVKPVTAGKNTANTYQKPAGAVRYVGANSGADWSSDGKRLAWVSKREGSYSYTIVIRNLDTGKEKEVNLRWRLHRRVVGYS